MQYSSLGFTEAVPSMVITYATPLIPLAHEQKSIFIPKHHTIHYLREPENIDPPHKH